MVGSVRAITVAAPWIACCIASALGAASLGGCYLSHEIVVDAGPVDARPPADAPGLDARDADAHVPLASCRGPIAGWTPTDAVIPGPWGRGIARVRDGQRTWIAAHSLDDGLVHLLDLDYEGALPSVGRDIPLEPAAGVPLAGAMDGARVAIAFASSSGGALLGVSIADPDGRRLADTLLMEPAAPSTLALRGSRLGLASGGGTAPFVSLIDASDGRVVGGDAFTGAAEVSVGLGRGLFSAIVTPAEGDSRLVGVDDLGTIDAGSIGVRLLAMTWDGTAVAGVEPDGAIVARVTALRIERFVPPTALGAISLAMRGGAPWIAAVGLDGDVWFVSEEGFVRRELPGIDVTFAVAAHASERHVGAFVLGDGTELRWVGWSCDPDR